MKARASIFPGTGTIKTFGSRVQQVHLQQLRSIPAAALLVLLLSGCASTPKVHTLAVPGMDYAQYHTFVVSPLAMTSPVSDPGLVSRVAGPARAAVVETLTRMGLRESDPVDADLAVSLKGAIIQKEWVTEWGYQPEPVSRSTLGRPVADYRPRGETIICYQERTLKLEMVDAHTKRLVWSGDLAMAATDQVEVERVQEAIRRLLTEFPAGSQATLAVR